MGRAKEVKEEHKYITASCCYSWRHEFIHANAFTTTNYIFWLDVFVSTRTVEYDSHHCLPAGFSINLDLTVH